jgi:putative ABC transport system permease protein
MARVQDKYVAKNNQWYKFSLQPFWDVHLYSSAYQIVNQARTGDIQQVRILFWLALVVLALASINYMNLSTARAQQRFKEVGINKALGAKRTQVALRFYTETGILVLLALLISFLLLIVVLPWFNQLANKNLGIAQVFQGRILFYILGLGFFLTLLAGAYPALLLSGFNPKNLLHTSFRPKAYAGWIRRGLVIVQFTVAVALMSCTFVFRQQLYYIQQYDLGFNPDQVLALTISAAESQTQINKLIEASKTLSEVREVSTVQSYPGRGASIRSIQDPKNPE